MPTIGSKTTTYAAITGGSSPRTATINIGASTPGQHRVLVVHVNTVDDTDSVTGVTAQGAAMTAMTHVGVGTTANIYTFAILDPSEDGSNNIGLSISLAGDGTYPPAYWFYVVEDVDETTPWTDLGVDSGYSTSPSTGSLTVPTDGLIVAAMHHFFSSSFSTTAGTSQYEAIAASKPYALASRTTDGSCAWSTSSSNNWRVAAMGFYPPAGGDVTAPILSSPTGTATGDTTATIGATTDEGNGTIYGYVSTSATPPSGTDLKAGTGAVWAGSAAVSGTGAQTLNGTGLTASTGYYGHLIHTDAAANDSNIVTSALFTTDAPNSAPSWSGTPSAMSTKRGQGIDAQDITSLVSDADLDTLTYTITGAPTGITIDPDTGIISGTPTAAPGVYACTVEADDGVASPVASSSFNITVTQAVLALSGAGYEFGDGNDPATMAVVASTELQVAAYPLTEWPPASAIATVTATTGTNGRLADLGDDDLSFGTTYRVIARNAADGETWAWTMTAS